MTGSTHQERAILEARAEALARPRKTVVDRDGMEVVAFRLAREQYAIAATHVIAASLLRDFTPLPRGQSVLVGLTEWRGTLLSLIDPRQLLGLSTAALDDLRHVVIVGDRRRHVGILVDAVIGTRRIDADSLQAPSGAREQRLVIGVSSDALVLLDGAAIANST
jgi:purine-binding chemotaxis protein CheW